MNVNKPALQVSKNFKMFANLTPAPSAHRTGNVWQIAFLKPVGGPLWCEFSQTNSVAKDTRLANCSWVSLLLEVELLWDTVNWIKTVKSLPMARFFAPFLSERFNKRVRDRPYRGRRCYNFFYKLSLRRLISRMLSFYPNETSNLGQLIQNKGVWCKKQQFNGHRLISKWIAGSNVILWSSIDKAGFELPKTLQCSQYWQ